MSHSIKELLQNALPRIASRLSHFPFLFSTSIWPCRLQQHQTLEVFHTIRALEGNMDKDPSGGNHDAAMQSFDSLLGPTPRAGSGNKRDCLQNLLGVYATGRDV